MKICEDSLCTGCGVCEAVCPVSAIEMKRDDFGFTRPHIDDDKCINCGLCKRKCIADGFKRETEVKGVYAATLSETDNLEKVSSGGAFWALARTILSKEGVVYGAVMEGVYSVRHRRADNKDDASAFRRSKYLQSDMGDCYRRIKEDLENGRKVLFSGTPCQVAAVYSYIGENDNLYACEIICHGVPSGLVFEKYISELEKENDSSVTNIVFRNKKFGWGNNHYAIYFENGSVIEEPSVTNAFHSTYLAGMISRESCGNCKFSHLPRTADIVLADYWKYEGELGDLSKGMGVSLVVCMTDKGNRLTNDAVEFMHLEESDIELAKTSCRHLNNAPGSNRYRELFMNDIVHKSFRETVDIYMSDGRTPSAFWKKVSRRLAYEKKRREHKANK